MLPYSTAVRLIALTITLVPVNCFLMGALWFGQEPASGVAAPPPKFTCKGLPLRHGETPSESYRHAYQLCGGAFDSPNQYLHAGQLLFLGGALVGPGDALKRHKTAPKITCTNHMRRYGETPSEPYRHAY